MDTETIIYIVLGIGYILFRVLGNSGKKKQQKRTRPLTKSQPQPQSSRQPAGQSRQTQAQKTTPPRKQAPRREMSLEELLREISGQQTRPQQPPPTPKAPPPPPPKRKAKAKSKLIRKQEHDPFLQQEDTIHPGHAHPHTHPHNAPGVTGHGRPQLLGKDLDMRQAILHSIILERKYT